MRAKLGWVAAVVAVSVALPAAPARSSGGSTGWQGFKADRVELLETLSPAFVSCFKRRDSAVDPLSPIFHGCIDWHSAVHAAYSHHVLYRRTGDDEFMRLIDDQFAPQGISLIPLEEAYQRAKAPNFPLTENPYGFGWFLVLAREREESTGKKDLRPMADFAADQMVGWFEERLARGDADTYIINRAHANYSWSLMNLDLWARYTGDKELREVVEAAGEPLRAERLDGLCDDLKTELSDRATGFQSPCFMRLAAVAQIWGAEAKGFVEERLPEDLRIDPVENPNGCHAGGLNFTRAFGLWKLYLVTGDSGLRDNYAELIRYHVSRPDLYEGESYLGNPDYLCYSHWVAQVGVRAISLSYEPTSVR
ncbi:MAG: DUF2891 domain-containing protein [Actinomycetota bacterium]|nr:DUF2891 domain-containing protein [Actinomycetota bacterium]